MDPSLNVSTDEVVIESQNPAMEGLADSELDAATRPSRPLTRRTTGSSRLDISASGTENIDPSRRPVSSMSSSTQSIVNLSSRRISESLFAEESVRRIDPASQVSFVETNRSPVRSEGTAQPPVLPSTRSHNSMRPFSTQSIYSGRGRSDSMASYHSSVAGGFNDTSNVAESGSQASPAYLAAAAALSAAQPKPAGYSRRPTAENASLSVSSIFHTKRERSGSTQSSGFPTPASIRPRGFSSMAPLEQQPSEGGSVQRTESKDVARKPSFMAPRAPTAGPAAFSNSPSFLLQPSPMISGSDPSNGPVGFPLRGAQGVALSKYIQEEKEEDIERELEDEHEEEEKEEAAAEKARLRGGLRDSVNPNFVPVAGTLVAPDRGILGNDLASKQFDARFKNRIRGCAFYCNYFIGLLLDPTFLIGIAFIIVGTALFYTDAQWEFWTNNGWKWFFYFGCMLLALIPLRFIEWCFYKIVDAAARNSYLSEICDFLNAGRYRLAYIADLVLVLLVPGYVFNIGFDGTNYWYFLATMSSLLVIFVGLVVKDIIAKIILRRIFITKNQKRVREVIFYEEVVRRLTGPLDYRNASVKAGGINRVLTPTIMLEDGSFWRQAAYVRSSFFTMCDAEGYVCIVETEEGATELALAAFDRLVLEKLKKQRLEAMRAEMRRRIIERESLLGRASVPNPAVTKDRTSMISSVISAIASPLAMLMPDHHSKPHESKPDIRQAVKSEVTPAPTPTHVPKETKRSISEPNMVPSSSLASGASFPAGQSAVAPTISNEPATASVKPEVELENQAASSPTREDERDDFSQKNPYYESMNDLRNPEDIDMDEIDTNALLEQIFGSFITKDDLRICFSSKADREAVFALLDLDSNGLVSREEFINSIKLMYGAWNTTKTSLESYGGISGAISWIIFIIYAIIVIITILSIFSLNFWSIYSSATSLFLSFSFAFSNTLQNFVNSMIFVLSLTPYEVGDRVTISGVNNGNQMIVAQVNVLTSEFDTGVGLRLIARNCDITTMSISNYKRSPNACYTAAFILHLGVTSEQLKLLHDTLNQYVLEHPLEWKPSVSMSCSNLSIPNQLQVSFYVTNRASWQDVAKHGPAYTAFVIFAVQKMREFNIAFASTPQTVILANLATSSSNVSKKQYLEIAAVNDLSHGGKELYETIPEETADDITPIPEAVVVNGAPVASNGPLSNNPLSRGVALTPLIGEATVVDGIRKRK
jgi:Mechanosensitive ion channel